MYVEVVYKGSYFIFPDPQAILWLKGSNTLVIETVYGRHEFTGVDKELWAQISMQMMPNAALQVNLDKKTVRSMGPF